MDDLFPSTERDIRMQRALCVVSLLAGDVPYCRKIGIRDGLDASMPDGAQLALTDGARAVAALVPGASVEKGTVKTSADGRAVFSLRLKEG